MIRVILVAGAIAALAGVVLWLYSPDKDRTILEAHYAPPPSQFIMIEGLRLHLRDTGPRDAPAVILLHGFGASLHTWEEWAHALEKSHRVIRYDAPGFGLTGADPAGVYTRGRDMAVLLALMDRLGLARASLIGHSMGGGVAWNFAARHPDRVERLILVSPDGFASLGFDYDKAPDVPASMRLLPYAMPGFMLRMSLAPGYGDKAALTDALFTRYRDMMLAPGVRRAIIARMQQVRLVDPAPLLRRISQPVLLLWGTADAMIPFANAADYQRALPQAKLATLQGVGHLPQEEAPAVSLAYVMAFLAGV